MPRASHRPTRSIRDILICSLLTIVLAACAPPHLQGAVAHVPPVICSTVDPLAPTPTGSATYSSRSPMEGMIELPPGRPPRVIATASGGGAALSINIPDVPLLVGGAIGLVFVVRNDSSDSLEVTEPRVDIEDEAGNGPTFPGFVPGNWPGSYPAPGNRQILPGQSLKGIPNIQLPDANDLKGHAYHLFAQTDVLSPSHPDPTGSGTPLQTRSPVLALVQPNAAQQLHAELYPESGGWCLQVLAGDGSRPTSPLAATYWAETPTGRGAVATGGPLQGGDHGVWVGTWPEVLRTGGPIHVQIWVAGPEYVTAQIDQMLPGN